LDLTGKRILVTGASSGIGKAIAVMAAARGAIVILHGRNLDKLRAVQASLAGSDHAIYARDLSETDTGLEAWLDQIVKVVGPLAGLVHSAGYGKIEPLKVVKAAELDRIWRVNVASAILLAKAMRKPVNHEVGASLVFLSSVAGIRGQAGQIAYAATKGALIAMTRAMALELVRDNLRVNALAPAMVETELFLEMQRANSSDAIDAIRAAHPSGFGQPQDVAAMACFLLSDEAKWVTGATFPVDGGYTA
jgi:NAD(P)-dependent dehydrogenase (short-subunit alcohol dehydrogenase family)